MSTRRCAQQSTISAASACTLPRGHAGDHVFRPRATSDARFARRLAYYRDRGLRLVDAWKVTREAMRLADIIDESRGDTYRVDVEGIPVRVVMDHDADAWTSGEHPMGDESTMWTYQEARNYASSRGMARNDAHLWACDAVRRDVEAWARDDGWSPYWFVASVDGVEYASLGGVWIDDRDIYCDDYVRDAVWDVAQEAAAQYAEHKARERAYLASL